MSIIQKFPGCTLVSVAQGPRDQSSVMLLFFWLSVVYMLYCAKWIDHYCISGCESSGKDAA